MGEEQQLELPKVVLEIQENGSISIDIGNLPDYIAWGVILKAAATIKLQT